MPKLPRRAEPEEEEDDDELQEDPAEAKAGEAEPGAAVPAAAAAADRAAVVEEAAALSARLAKRGVVYLSRVPPFMKPAKLRHLLGKHGALGRLYLAPEEEAARARRRRAGGNSGRKFTEAWVEFDDKKVAKRVAQCLNGGPRRSAFHFDLWNLKYLKGFKWDLLTAELAHARALRERRLALELGAAKRERDFYLGQVDAAKAAEGMEAKRARRAAAATAAAGGGGGGAAAAAAAPAGGGGAGGDAGAAARPGRVFAQRKVRAPPGRAHRVSNATLRLIMPGGGGGGGGGDE